MINITTQKGTNANKNIKNTSYMDKKYNQIWDNCLKTIQSEVPQQSFETWFKPIIPQDYSKNTLTISVPSQFFYEWLEGHYVDLLRKVIHNELGPKGRLVYKVQNQKKGQLPNKKENTIKHSQILSIIFIYSF